MSSSLSEPRSRSRCASSRIDGATMKISTASGECALSCIAPCVSMSSSTSMPAASARSSVLARLGCDRVDLAIQLLQQEVERASHRAALVEEEAELVQMRAQPCQLFGDVALLRPHRDFGEDTRLVDGRALEQRPDALAQAL